MPDTADDRDALGTKDRGVPERLRSGACQRHETVAQEPGEDVLRIGVENEAMRRELTRAKTLERLRTLAGEVAGHEMQVEIGPLPAEHAGAAPLAQARRRTEERLGDPLVKAAVEIFGAEVRGVREPRS